jgi:hypothetical protein
VGIVFSFLPASPLAPSTAPTAAALSTPGKSGSEGGRQKRATLAPRWRAHPTSRTVQEEDDGKGPAPRAPRRRRSRAVDRGEPEHSGSTPSALGASASAPPNGRLRDRRTMQASPRPRGRASPSGLQSHAATGTVDQPWKGHIPRKERSLGSAHHTADWQAIPRSLHMIGGGSARSFDTNPGIRHALSALP